LRSRIYGRRLDEPAFAAIIGDIVGGRYPDVHLSAFLTAYATLPMDDSETVALTRVMVEAGERFEWPASPILDKHSVGGLPGNRTTPIIVAVVAANDLTIPKTSSRAITSPAGTADTMETMAPVALDLAAIRRVVEQEGGCVAWGGSIRLSPADDFLIRSSGRSISTAKASWWPRCCPRKSPLVRPASFWMFRSDRRRRSGAKRQRRRLPGGFLWLRPLLA
jgi:thymidine phosphorylase